MCPYLDIVLSLSLQELPRYCRKGEFFKCWHQLLNVIRGFEKMSNIVFLSGDWLDRHQSLFIRPQEVEVACTVMTVRTDTKQALVGAATGTRDRQRLVYAKTR